MRGSVVKRSKGYAVVVELARDPQTGKRRQKWHSGFRTKRDAERALAGIVNAVNSGGYVAPTRQTVESFAREWLAAVEPTVRPSTHYSYARNLRLHVLPVIGSVPLTTLDAGTLNGLYARLLADGRKDQAGGGLAPRSVAYLHILIGRMLKDAVRWGRLARNVATAADPPKASASGKPAMRTWTATQVRMFLSFVAEDRQYALWLLLATTGLRRGEALGLRWDHLDLDAGRASISQTVIMVHHKVVFGDPKTAKGRRTVTLDAWTVAALREHRRRQAAERLAAGAGWADHGLVFTKLGGSPLHPEGDVSRRFATLVGRSGLPRVRLHDLRHTWASLALADGIHPKVVQERLGHANISITLDTYSHVVAGLHEQAAERVAGLVFDPPDQAAR